MSNTPAIMCRLCHVDVVSSLIKICNSLYDGFPIKQRNNLRDYIHREVNLGNYFLLVLLDSTSVEVLNEFKVYINNSEEQKHIKKLLNRKLPIILAVSFFDDYEFPQGEICVVSYSRLLDRVSSMTFFENQNHKRLLRYIKSRRIAWRLSYKAVTIEEFIEELRKEHQN